MIDFAAICESIDMLALCPGVRSVGKQSWRGRCPLCDSSDGLAIRRDRLILRFHCFACGERGSALDLVAKIDGCTVRDVLVRFGGKPPEVNPEQRLARMADAQRSTEGDYLIACDVEGCDKYAWLPQLIDAAVIAAHGSNVWDLRNGEAFCVNHR